jgi:hypothetical protein
MNPTTKMAMKITSQEPAGLAISTSGHLRMKIDKSVLVKMSTLWADELIRHEITDVFTHI